MKMTFNIECTPEEARSFLGLPDVKPMQEAFLKDIETRMRANMQAMDPESLFKTWLPASMQNAENVQKLFWSQMQQAFSGFGNPALTMFGDKNKGQG